MFDYFYNNEKKNRNEIDGTVREREKDVSWNTIA